MEPLDTMFRAAGLQPERLIDQVRRGYSGRGSADADLVFDQGRSGKPRGTARERDPAGTRPDEHVPDRGAEGTVREPDTCCSALHLRFRDAPRSQDGWPPDALRAGLCRPHGTAIHATADGVVKLARSHGGYGRTVIIQHEFGIETLYAHMSQIRVNEGQRVSRGDRIGDMGNTGRSTGTHLHYEVRLGGTAVNPMTYIKAARNVF
jgi:hypothetical protein